MKKMLNTVLLLILTQAACQKKVKTEIFYGHNKYHMPACIIETDIKLNQKEIKDFSLKTYDRHPDQEGSVCTILKYKNTPYSIIYNHKFFAYEVPDTIYSFEDFITKYRNMITKFESLKSETVAKSHSIYGYYASLGSAGHKYDAGYLGIITRDSIGNYFMANAYLCKGCQIYFEPISKTDNGFIKEHKVWDTYNNHEKLTKTIYYERNEDIIIKDLQYVKEDVEKYLCYLLKIR
jgi:hypothetical protein